MNRIFYAIFSLTIGVAVTGAFAAPDVPASVNQETGAKTWRTDRHGVHFEVTQILPDQLRAFYVNRGFTLQQAEPYANSCVFMTVLRNDGAPGAIHFVSHDWEVLTQGRPHALVSVDSWLSRLRARGVSQSAQLAFRWAQFPPEQSYEPGGDWNQGMLSVGLSPGVRFDITASWDMNGQNYGAGLEGVTCAE